MTILTSENIADLTQEIWSAMLSEHAPLMPGDAPAGDIQAAVDIAGEWNGTVGLSCSRDAARIATGAIFGLPDDEITEADISDAVGELANVVSGNIKSLVPGPSTLSVPQLHDGSWTDHPGRLALVLEVRFSWVDEPVVVRVWTDDPH